MKCPKCGYNSFEYYDSCKKCSNDLTGFKMAHSITAIVLPLEAKEELAAAGRPEEQSPDPNSPVAENHDDIFSFNLPEGEEDDPFRSNDSPFNFSEPPADATPVSAPPAVDDMFSDLLESTSQSDASPFGAVSAADSPPVAAAPAPAGPAEFELDSFSWDDSAAPAAAPPAEPPAPASAPAFDDLDALFGELKDSKPS